MQPPPHFLRRRLSGRAEVLTLCVSVRKLSRVGFQPVVATFS